MVILLILYNQNPNTGNGHVPGWSCILSVDINPGARHSNVEAGLGVVVLLTLLSPLHAQENDIVCTLRHTHYMRRH